MSFFNARGDLVGFDVELAEHLAYTLKVQPEFVPVSWPDVPRMLEEGQIDVMPGMWYRPYWFDRLQLSDPYVITTIGFAVKDERRHDFDTLEKIERTRGLKIAVPIDTTQIEHSMKQYFAGADAEFISVTFWDEYFRGEHPDIDAFLMPAEHASGWTLLHPEYTVVVPQPDPVKLPEAFGVALGADELVRLINEWIVFSSNAGMVNKAYDFWITGQGAKSTEPRWSIMRNLLGWGTE